jgi:hypothetical protein
MGNLQNSFKKALFLFFLLFSSFVFTTRVKADEISIQCSNRYLTLINPVRDRSLWKDPSLNPLKQQYADVKKYSFPATWLLQYDTFSDTDLTHEVLSFDSNQEKGIFLEVSRKLAFDAGVTYPIYLRWSDPGAVFLSAYSQSERRKLIDKAFEGYKKIYGTYPKSVGAWWIDSYSFDYMVSKYKIESALILADQKVTDSYGVWGGWWGFPYKPSKANILVPASNAGNSEDAVVVQWAQRDPILAYGGVGLFSRYSLQANDYTVVGRDINYFKNLTSQYLDCKNQLGQITVGLETGMESLMAPAEYQKQLSYLSSIPGLNVVTMNEFAQKYSQVYDVNPDKVNPDKILFGDAGSNWEMTTSYRKNEKLGDYINYNQQLSFKDYFLADHSSFLARVMPISGNVKSLIPWYLLASFILLLISLKFKLFKVWFVSTLVSLVGYGLIFRSTYKFGWEVFYGVQVGELVLVQVLVVILVFVTTLLINKIFKHKFNLWLLALAFGLDRILSLFRYTSIEGVKYFGIVFGKDGIIGIKILGHSLHFINQNFEPIQFQALIKFDFSKIWQNELIYFIAYPLIHFVLAFILWRILGRLSGKVRFAIYVLLTILFIWEVRVVFVSDPLSVLPLK